MTKSIDELINDYNADSIQTKEPLVHIRMRPSMYVGSVSGTPNHLFEETLMNAMDEYGIGVATEIKVRIRDDHSLEVTDDGRGIPPMYDKKSGMPVARKALTTINTGKSFNSKTPGSSRHGVGMKAVLATSDWMTVKIWRNDREYHDGFETLDGKPGIPTVTLKKGDDLPSIKRPAGTPEHGTQIAFKPSADVWKHPNFDWERIKKLCDDLSYIHDDLKFTLINDVTGEEITYYNRGGVKQFIQNIVSDTPNMKLITPVYQVNGAFDAENNVGVKKETNHIEAEVYFAWSNETSNKNFLFTNNVPNPDGGTPVSGFNNAITRLINKYAKDLNLSKDTINQRDITPGLISFIVMTHPDPDFDGQTKHSVSSDDAKRALSSIVYNNGQLQFDRSIDSVRDIIKLALQRYKDRKKEEDDKVNLKTKEIRKIVNKKLEPSKKTGMNSELFIVEGDSAAGTLTDQRDTNYQAVMPVKGKVLNTYKASASKTMGNSELATIFAAIGTGLGSDFDIKKANYSKIIIATDSDSDGGHISSLLITAFIKFVPELVREGYIYKALSPLYVNVMKSGRGRKAKEVYTYTEGEQKEFLSKNKGRVSDIQRNKGLGELTPEQVSSTLIEGDTRVLQQLVLDDDNETNAYNYLDIFMGTSSESRKEFFAQTSIYEENSED